MELLFDSKDFTALKGLVVDGKYIDRVDYVGMEAEDTCGLSKLLVRPGGIIAWRAEMNMKPYSNTANASFQQRLAIELVIMGIWDSMLRGLLMNCP